ncbi:MAG: response regulator transcription factor [Elusimicrobiota bacterium]
MREKILIIDDEQEVVDYLKASLERENFSTITAMSGGEAISLVHEINPDLLLLDIGLPDMSGLEVCRILKQDKKTASLPIIMVTAFRDLEDKIEGLELGADDYLTKPFELKELTARIKSLFRRLDYGGEPWEIIEKGMVSININQVTVKVNGILKENITHREFDLLYLLMKKSPKVLSRNYLLETIWGSEFSATPRAVDTAIKRLRQKLGNGEAKLIKTVEGFGYKFDSDN